MGYGGSDDRRKPQSVNDVGERGWGRKILDFTSLVSREGAYVAYIVYMLYIIDDLAIPIHEAGQM